MLSNSLEYETTFFFPTKSITQTIELRVAAGKRLSWPSELRPHGFQAHEVSQDLVEIYQFPPAQPRHKLSCIFLRTEGQQLGFSCQRNLTLKKQTNKKKTIVNFQKEEKRNSKANACQS